MVQNDLAIERSVFHDVNNKLKSYMFSTTFAIFSAAVPFCIQLVRIFKQDCTQYFTKLLRLLSVLAQLIHLIYYWPFSYSYKSVLSTFVLRTHRRLYCRCLELLATKYVDNVHSTIISGVTAASVIHKPNYIGWFNFLCIQSLVLVTLASSPILLL